MTKQSAALEHPSPPGIGVKLRDARLARRMTLATLALSSGLTRGFLSKLERDQVAASVASLVRICEVLQVPMGTLFEANEGALVRREDQPVIDFGGVGMTEFLLTPSGEQRVQAILSEIAPTGGSGPGQYKLPADVEFVYVLSGELEIFLGERTVRLHSGDAYTFPASEPHGFRAPEDAPTTRVLWVIAPGLALAGEASQEGNNRFEVGRGKADK